MIIGKKIYLRPLENSDLDFMLTLINNQELAFWEGRNEFLISKEQQKKWFLENINSGHRFIICDNETHHPLGYFSFKYTNKVAKSGLVAIKLVKESRGKNIGTDALKTGMSFLFNKMNLHRLHTHIISYNEASKKLFEKCFWTIEGKERESIFMNSNYYDNYLLSILDHEYHLHEDSYYKNLFNFN